MPQPRAMPIPAPAHRVTQMLYGKQQTCGQPGPETLKVGTQLRFRSAQLLY